MRKVLFLLIFSMIAGACTNNLSNSKTQISNSARSLAVVEIPVPAIKVPHYSTSGTYPQLQGEESKIRETDYAITQIIEADEAAYSSTALRQEMMVPYIPSSGPGIYKLLPSKNLMSASSVVVSALIPAIELYPGGTDGMEWLSVTIYVPSGKPVNLLGIFLSPTEALRVIASWAEQEVQATYSCVKSQDQFLTKTGQRIPGFSATAINYQYLALVPNGLAIGFPNGQFTSPSCGRMEVTVPFSVISPYLSKFGQTLVSGVRSPT